MKIIFTSIFFLLTHIALAERNKSEMQPVPNFLKGIEWNGKILRHGYIQWLDKRPYSPSNDPKLVKEGSAIYTKHCLQCHGENGKGDGPVAKKYGVKAASITKSSKNLSNHTLFVQVAEGRGDMPQWVDVLTEEEIWALTQYLQSMK
jgi:mono/diheme cytochrome c family protein